MRPAPTWNLESLYPGGPRGEAWLAAASAAEARIDALVARADALPPLPEDVDAWSHVIRDLFAVHEQAGQVRVFATCWASADALSGAAKQAYARSSAMWSRIERAWVPVEDGIASASADAWSALAGRAELADCMPRLVWVRQHAALRLPRAEQALATELARDGLHAWGQLYDTVSGALTVACPEGPLRDRTQAPRVGIAQANNLVGEADPALRIAAHDAIEAAWTSVREPCAAALTHIVGTRQILNDRRGVDELADSLARNRMKRETLDAMLEAARRAGPLLERYLHAKAHALGLARLGWQDVSAPLGEDRAWSWEVAEDFVLDHFGSWHPDLRDYAARAFAERWIEAEDRGGKRQGGWCAGVPLHPGASRIFMTFGETFRSTTTLAHELGHGFHNWAMQSVAPGRRYVPATLAETASVFAENIVRDAALEAATDDAARLAMLDARLQAGVSFLMNIPFRYALERALYGHRRAGHLDPNVLSEQTVALQREAYRDTLATWDPLFWCSKLHFYITSFAFYNYPYTFGYLFSGLVYQRARAEGRGWHGRYVEMLRKTGEERAEPLALEFLGLDLTDPDAWYGGVAPLEHDLVAFERIVTS